MSRARREPGDHGVVWACLAALLLATPVAILPAFYQTRGFFLLCFAASAFLVWAAYRWRLRQIAARLDLQFQERLAERTLIAQDLHDTLLQGVLSASMQLHVEVWSRAGAGTEIELSVPAEIAFHRKPAAGPLGWLNRFGPGSEREE